MIQMTQIIGGSKTPPKNQNIKNILLGVGLKTEKD